MRSPKTEAAAMITQFMIKEWKEKFSFFVLAMLLLVGLAGYSLFGSKETAATVAGALLMWILPMISIMIGSSSFAWEFKNDAWAYLFSRPVKKATVWLVKYLAGLAVIISVFMIFLLLLQLLPGINETIKSSSVRISERDIPLFSLCLLGTILAFTVAFCISFLSEKQLIIFLVTLLIVVAAVFLFQKYFELLFFINPQAGRFDAVPLGIWALLGLSIAGASLLTFIKSDFSQPLEKSWTFAKFVGILLLISVACCTAWTWRIFSLKKEKMMSGMEITRDAAYFGTETEIFRFDPAQNKLRKIDRIGSALFSGELSVGGEKLAVLKFKPVKKGKTYTGAPVLLLMNLDGSGKKDLLKNYSKKDSPFYDQYIWPFLTSPDGAKVAFVTRDWKNKESTIWTINSDGAELRSQPLDLPDIDWLNFVGWEISGRYLLISTLSKRGTAAANNTLLSFDLETGRYQVLADDLRRPFAARVSPGRDFVVYCFYDEKAAQEVLAKTDLRSLAKEEIYRGGSIEMFRLNKGGDKIAFLAEKGKLGLYSFSEKKTIVMALYKPGQKPSRVYSLDWVGGDNELVFGDNINSESCLRVFGTDLVEKKTIKIPFSLEYIQFQALNNNVFITDYKTSELWAIDIATEKWRKVY
jgi:ABC-type transport system involved in multi-copper enzyme maturation permease subunit